jgi:hypothetical protein
MRTKRNMNDYEILAWCNDVLQGQFRKYGSVINQVGVFCVNNTNSVEEAQEWFKEVNLTVARISAMEPQYQELEEEFEENEDAPDVLEYAEKLNNHIDIRKMWMKLKILAVGKFVIAINNKPGEEDIGEIIDLSFRIEVKFENGIKSFSENSWKEYSGFNEKPDFWFIKEIF